MDGSFYSPGVNASPSTKEDHVLTYARQIVTDALYDVSEELNRRRIGLLKAGMSEQADVLSGAIKLVEGKIEGARRFRGPDSKNLTASYGSGTDEGVEATEKVETSNGLVDVEQNVAQKISKFLHLKDDAEAEAPAAPAPDRCCIVVQLCDLSAKELDRVKGEKTKLLLVQTEVKNHIEKMLPEMVRSHFNMWVDAIKEDRVALLHREYKGVLKIDATKVDREAGAMLAETAKGLMKDLLEENGFAVQSTYAGPYQAGVRATEVTFTW